MSTPTIPISRCATSTFSRPAAIFSCRISSRPRRSTSLSACSARTRDFAVTTDFAFRHYIHEMLRGVDLNHYTAVGGPVIPACAPEQATVAGVQCSNGPIQASISGGNGTYKALLVRADKRFSHRHSIGVAYALQSDRNIYGLNLL